MSTSLISPYAPSLVEEFEVHLLPPGSPSAVQAKDEEMVRLEDWRNVEDMLEKVLCQSEAFSEHKPFHSYSPDIVLRSVRSLVDWGDSPQLSDAIQKRLVSYTLMALGSIAASVGEIQANEESPSARANQAFTAVAAFRRSYIMKLQEITKVWTYYGYYCGAYSTGKDGHGGSTIQNLGEKCLKDALESVPELFDQALSGLFDAVRRDLNNFGQVDIEKGHTSDDEEEHYSSTTTDVTFLHDSIKQLVLLANTAHCYGTRIEPTVISMIREHYERRVEEHSASGTIPAKYFTWVEGAIQLEKERAAAYLQPETLPSLEKVVYTALLGDVAVNILRGNFRVMMEESAFQCLGKVSRIFQASFLSEEPKQMRSIFRQYLEEAGGEWMGQLGKLPPFAVTNGLIQLMRHSQAAIEQAFSGDKDYTLQLHEAFQVILDAKPQKLSEELTDYLDYVMRVPEGEPLQPSPASAHLVSLAERSGRTPTAAVDAIVDSQQLIQHIGHVFSYLPNKDVFEELYWRGFAARLLDPFQRTSVASEEAFIGILKGICGQSFVSKFEGMLKDVRHFQKNGDAFRTWVDGSGTPPASQLLSALRPHLSTKPTPEEEKAKLGGPPSSVVETPGAAAAVVVHPEDFKLLPRGVQTDIYFLTKGYWPHFAPLTPRLPSQWNHLCSMVERFYLQAFSSRVVTWRHDLSTAVLVGKFQSNTYELCGTLIQCIALMKLDDMTAGAEEASVSMEALCAELEVDLTSVEVMSSLRGLCSEEVGLLSVTRSASSPVNSTVGGALQLADHVGINNRFTCPTSQVQLSVRRPSQEKSDEKGEAGNPAAPERNYIVEISIVRHMKCHHTATHEALVAQVTNDARYAVTPGTIKKVLAKLITQGYLERMGTEGYRYLS